MVDKPVAGHDVGGQNRRGGVVTDDAVSAWFVREILPLEPGLMTYLRHNWRNASEVADLRQEIYVRVLQSARERIPEDARRFLFACARNLLIDLVRRNRIVPIDAIPDLEALDVALDAPPPDRTVMAREELRRLEAALSQLPARPREAVRLAYFVGLTGKEIAKRMGITPAAASQHLANGVVALTDILYGPKSEGGAK